MNEETQVNPNQPQAPAEQPVQQPVQQQPAPQYNAPTGSGGNKKTLWIIITAVVIALVLITVIFFVKPAEETEPSPDTTPTGSPVATSLPNTDISKCSLPGQWLQTGCADFNWKPTDCLAPPSEVARVFTITSENDVYNDCRGSGCLGEPTHGFEKDGSFCVSTGVEDLCFPYYFDDCNTMYYCLAPVDTPLTPEMKTAIVCEKLERE